MTEPDFEALRQAFNRELELVMVGHSTKAVVTGLGDAMVGVICASMDRGDAIEFIDKFASDLKKNVQRAWDYYQSPESRRSMSGSQIGSA